MDKVRLIKKHIKGQPGYDVKLVDRDVTVGEYLEAMNDFIESGQVERLWPRGRHECRGCDLCCHEPLPLTSVDVYNICQATGMDSRAVFRYLWVEARGNGIDITLRRGDGDNCVFLNPTTGTCSIYKYRPFTCQTYICCQTSVRAELLRSRVVNLGMDELIRSSIQVFKRTGGKLPVNLSEGAVVRGSDWPKNCFTGQTDYHAIRLCEVLGSDFKRFLV